MADRGKDKSNKRILETEEINFYTEDTPHQELTIMHEEDNENFHESAGFANNFRRDGKATDVTLGLRNMGLR